MSKIYFVQYSGPYVGTDTADIVVANDEQDAVDQCYAAAVEWYEGFLETYEDGSPEDWVEPEVDIWAEEYDPEKHDGLWPGGNPSEDFINQLKQQLKD
jgi:hypothetical protein